MATQIQLRRGTTVQHSSFTGAIAEVTVDTDKETVIVHDGSTAGGFPLATEAQVNDRMQVANVQSYVTTQINTVLDGAPAALDTLNELAAALGDDANFATTITTSIGTKASNTYVNAQIGASNTNIRNYTNQTFVTKAVALTTNNAIVNLVNDRLQVANAAATYSTLTQLGNTNSYIASVQTNVNTQIGSSNTALRAFANQTFETKAVALASNTAQNNLINDRLQVANANITFETKAVALAANTAQNSLILDRIQVANVAAIYATKSYAAANTYVNAQIGSSNTSIRQYVNAQIGSSNTSIRQYVNAQIGSSNTNIRNYTDTTYETKAVALTSNNAQNSLILDRLQIANATSLFVNVTGDTMSGALAMGTNKITGMGNPTAAQDAATKTYVDTQVANVVDSAPEALNTLNELAAALGDDANFATTTATTLGTKAANTYVNATFSTLTQLGNTNSYIATKADASTQVIAGSGLTGGGTLAADRTLNIGAGTGITVADNSISTNDGAIVHNNLSGFVADEHIAHSGVTLTAGDGLTGGGTIAASRSFAVGAGTLIDVTADAVNVDLSELTTSTSDGDGDFFVVVDSVNAQKKLTKANINISGFNNDSGFTTNVGDITGVTAGTNLNGGGASGGVTLNVDSSPTFSGTVAAADFNSTSDIILKENIVTIDNPIAKVTELRGVNFDWKESGNHSMGVIAQEVENVLPEVVSENKDGNKTVNYDAMVGLLIEVVKDQQKQIDELKQIINNV